ncbi:MAG TPA: PAS domain S-box protein, partial [Xanthomonadaceae bacterium]|nr:PAS domain S-box protein [Xanthomonadaceae bacterium]
MRSAGQDEHASLAHFAAIVAHSDDAIVSKDLDGFIQSWNVGAERIFGYAASEVVGRSILLLIPAELCNEEAMILGKIRAGERIDHYETERLRKDGTRVPLSLSVSPIRDDSGRIVGASKIARDISERRHAESLVAEKQRLLAAEAQQLALLNDWSTKLWRCAALDEGMETILDAMIELLQADMGSIQLREGSVLRFTAQRGLDESFLDTFREVSARDESGCGRAMRLRKRIIIADTESDPAYGPYREAARRAGYRTVVSTPFLTSSEEVLGVVTVQFRHVHDPSEAALRRMDLCARQAGDFIQRCRMVQQLRDTDMRKDHFLALLAHELRNPLAPVRSGVQLLKMEALDPRTRMQAVAMLDRQVEHMVRLVDDLLDASRIGRGKIALQKKPIDLTSILLQAIETSRP